MENVIKELEEKLLRKEKECENNKIAYQMELDIYNQECLNLQEELKAKGQECERWKKANDEKNELLAKMGCPTIATARMKVFVLQQQIDELKAKNEELKNEIEACYNQVEDFDIIATSKSNKLKQAEQKLEKIREFATALCYRAMSNGVVTLQKDILQIIDEVE